MNAPARRIQPIDGKVPFDSMHPGDYCGPVMGYSDDRPAVFFVLPLDGGSIGGGFLLHVCSPPHVFRECDDGSLEIRESIACSNAQGMYWHGYLDEGNIWRQV